jgi:MerR family copper efflux transcriptional regulator
VSGAVNGAGGTEVTSTSSRVTVRFVVLAVLGGKGGVFWMEADLLRIGELASRAGVSTRTVDFYTGLGLLTPSRRSGGNFRLYQPSDVQRIEAIRRLEAQGIRLDDIAHAMTASARQDHSECVDPSVGTCPADPLALEAYLASVVEQVRALRDVAGVADPQTRGVLTTLAARAQALIATALLMSGGVLPGIDSLPPM